MNLYDKYAKEFSNTRQNPWKGWEQVAQELRDRDLGVSVPLRVLDLGCGNGRFLKYLTEEKFLVANYIGVDNSNLLLSEANDLVNKSKEDGEIASGDILKIDLNSKSWGYQIRGTFNVVVSFGVMHHINPFEIRKEFLDKALSFLDQNGVLAVSFWQFGALPRYENKKQPTEKNIGTKYSENDFILNFGNSKAERFCHFVNDEELKELEDDIEFSEAKTFINDGREDNENLYRIYVK